MASSKDIYYLFDLYSKVFLIKLKLRFDIGLHIFDRFKRLNIILLHPLCPEFSLLFENASGIGEKK